MIKDVVKRDGGVEKFDLDKLSRWAKYASKVGGDWSDLAIETFSRLPEVCKSSDIHQTMIDVCYSKEDIVYSRVAARLEIAQIRKSISRKLGIKVSKSDFKTIRQKLIDNGVWCKKTLPEYSDKQEQLYHSIVDIKLESWQITQWVDKYLMRIDGEVVETPHIAAMGIGLALHGDTQDAYDLTSDIINSRTNLPTPVLNGCRNGDFNGVSCCVISAGDSVESIEVGQHLAVRMTAKKAGIGVEFTTRSINDSVKNGKIKHLGKHPIYAHIDTGVKEFTQETRGGSATVGFVVIDPEVYNIALWKSQRIDIDQRLDKLDYSFIFNDAFVDAVVKRKDWYLFSISDAPKVHELFYTASVTDYHTVVEEYIRNGVKHTKVKALDLLKHLLIIRQETGRLYCFNVSRANTHTPFKDVIRLSNLCVAPETEILTKDGYQIISDLEGQDVEVWNGEEWSNTTVVKTGENQELFEVIVRVSVGGKEYIEKSLSCTGYHKWYDVHGNEIRTKDLELNTELLPWFDNEGNAIISYVSEIKDDGRFDDTYCFNEPKRHMGVFNGILTGQCQEINLPTKAYNNMEDLYLDNSNGETAFCSLAAQVPYKIISDEEYERVAFTTVKSITKVIEKCPKMTKNHERTMLERMSLGIGITGLAECLYQNRFDYDGSEESLEFVSDLAEKHLFYLYKASIKMAKETGKYAKGVDFNWLPVDTKINKYKPKQDWESIRGLPRYHAVLVAHMPTESSAVASGVLNGLYPPRKKIINKKSRKGVIQFICDSFVEGENLLAWNIDSVVLSKYYSVVQDWSDQGISADTYVNPNNYSGGKKPLSDVVKEWVAHFKLGNKSMYYLNTYDDDEVNVFDLLDGLSGGVEEEACEGCTL